MDTSGSNKRVAARHAHGVIEAALSLLMLTTLFVELDYVRQHAELVNTRVLRSAPVWIFTTGAIVSTAHVVAALSLHPTTHRRPRLAKAFAVVAAVWAISGLTVGAFLTPNPAWLLLVGAGTAMVLWIGTAVNDRRARTVEDTEVGVASGRTVRTTGRAFSGAGWCPPESRARRRGPRTDR